ncbi:unnamed protein product [Closterium sp. Naga37s-1]|nr:unnamed protein product [Closterium sp. Naga37s-1]
MQRGFRLRRCREQCSHGHLGRRQPGRALPLLVPLLLAALFVPRAADSACSSVRQVVVVGAGMSGVSAAHRIATTNGECFKVCWGAQDGSGGGARQGGLLHVVCKLTAPPPFLLFPPPPLTPNPPLPPSPPFPHPSTVVDRGGRQVFSSLPLLPFPPFSPHPSLASLGDIVTVVEGWAATVGLQRLLISTSLNPSSPLQVTVVEARGRVGGRMWSRTEAAPAGSPTAFLRGEMGAQWIEGATGNPVAALARRFKLRIGRQNGREIQYTANGKRYGEPRWTAAEADYQTLVRQGLAWANRQDKDVSLQQAFTSGPWKRRVFMKPYVQSRLSVDFEFDFAAPLSRLSAWYFDSLAFKPPTVVVTNGYDNIPQMLMQEAVAAGAVLTLNFEVTAIAQSSTGVQITGKNTATNAITTLDADVVIVTIPLGVLKANTIAFSPPLPPRKAGALARLGVGAIAKILFFFNQTFWPVNVDEYFIEDSQLPANRGRWVDWVNLKRVWGQTALMGVALGEYAERMNGMSDEEVINDAKAKMARMFPQYRKKPLEPLATWIQRWTAEPYSRGAYSYARVGVRGNEDHCTDYDVMALPEGRVLFAGEHTIWQYQATVHGALLSGVREAKRVLRNF